MKKFALYTFLSLSSILVAGDIIKYEIQPTIGYNSFDSSSKMESTFVYGIRGTVYPNSYYGYRLSYERSDNVHYDETSTKKTTNLQRISGQILVSGEEEYQVIPYLLLGGGYEMLSNEISNDVSQGYVEGGVGFKYHMKNDLIFDLEAKAMKKFDTDDIDYIVNFGLGYLFDPTMRKPALYQPGTLDEIPKVKNKVSVTPKTIKKKLIEPLASNKTVAKYTFTEEEVQNSFDASIPVTPYPTMIEDNQLVEKQYYIQVAAWFNAEDNKLLNHLENEGFTYNIENAIRLGRDAQLVKVGPYNHFTDAKLALKDLKKIKKDAFITKIK
jgi:cell division septation protein DedD